jgi:hypothetical protein
MLGDVRTQSVSRSSLSRNHQLAGLVGCGVTVQGVEGCRCNLPLGLS